MKIQNTDEHAEFQDMGDPIPTIPERVTKKRRRPQLLAIAVLLALCLSTFSTLNSYGAFRNTFPNSQTFQVGVAYSFANSGGSVLLPGSTGNLTLSVISAVNKPVTLQLSFNSTSPGEWAFGGFPNCYPATPGDLTMTISGQNILPVNTPLSAPANCSGSGNPGPGYPLLATVTVNPGRNDFTGTIDVSTNAQISSFVTISWFASQ